ncbi:glycosyltransferase [Coralloluteibacterium stylophorae]|uniref:Glycosyltransferase family 1 protein n=1 Tax=Coralloluteibacterium stylophorae TaxID=1776034 RepID=A0A8J8AW47_9GAMM|nr:glycosyltransferase [Coralloluteibacterium stylophorae]MBS7457298.1 glycosyltransferase family 1 protein [Coralloluteibacterium stylophorae]
MTGAWPLAAGEGWAPSPALQAFLDAGPAPVYIGFGSMGDTDPARTTRIALEALARAGRRGLIATGWGGLRADALPDDVFAIDHAPHDWLFARMAAVVHHGGAGTTHAVLRAGRGSVICPFFGDQPFWGRRVYALGAAPAPIAQRRLSAPALAAAIEAATGDAVATRAQALGARLREEDGVATAVRCIGRLARCTPRGRP